MPNGLTVPVTRCFNAEHGRLLPLLRLISPPNGSHSNWDGGSTCHICGNTISRDCYMLKCKNLTPGNGTRWRTALAISAATLFIGGRSSQPSGKITRPLPLTHPRPHFRPCAHTRLATPPVCCDTV